MSEIVSRPAFRRRPVGRTPARGLIHPIYAGVFDLDETTGFDTARNVVLDWLRTHPTVAPYLRDSSDGDFEIDRHLEHPRLFAQVLTAEGGNLVVARLQHQEHQNGVYDLIRNWRTDITIERTADSAWIATRNWFLGVDGDIRRCSPPRFIRDLIAQRALSDLDVIQPAVTALDYPDEAEFVADLALDPDRDLPVIIIADGCPLVPERLSRDLTGLVHIVQVNRDVRFALEPLLRPVFGVRHALLHGSITVVYPAAKDSLPQAVSAPFEDIVGAQFGDLSGPAAFVAQMHDGIGRAVVLRLLNDPAHRTLESVKAALIGARREELTAAPLDIATLRRNLDGTAAERDLYKDEVERLESELKDITGQAQSYAAEVQTLSELVHEEQRKNRALQNDKAALVHRLRSKNDDGDVVLDAEAVERLIEQEAAPKRVLDAVVRARETYEQYGIAATFSTTAFEAAEKSPFLRPKDIFAVLLRLGFFWKDLRQSGARIEDDAHRVLRAPLALHESKTTKQNYMGERFCRFDGGTATLEKHITLGGGPKQIPENTAQIFFGDNENGALLIGHVGRHLRIGRSE